jgi:hypothetical protein
MAAPLRSVKMRRFLSFLKKRLGCNSNGSPAEDNPREDIRIADWTDWSKKTILYKNVTISLHNIEEYIIEYIKLRHPENFEQRLARSMWHSRRYFASLAYIIEYGLHRGNIFEAGDAAIFTTMLDRFIGDCTITHDKGDLRRLHELPPSSFSSIICMEVFEHIADESTMDDFLFDGVKKMMRSFWDMLVPGGKIFLTTPNSCGVFSIERVLQGKTPLMWPLHAREYTLQELIAIVTALGFSLEQARAEYVFVAEYPKKILSLLKNNRYSLEERGDDSFLVLSKPEHGQFNEGADLVQAIIQCCSYSTG